MCKKPENVVDVIQLLKEPLPPQQDEDSLLFIDIRRDFVLQDALREGRKAKFTTNKHGLAFYTQYTMFSSLVNL